MVQVIPLLSTLTNTSEDRVPTISLSDIINQLLNKDSLANTSTTKETNFPSISIQSKQVNNLNTSNQNLCSSGLVSKGRRVSVNKQELISLNRATLVNQVTGNVYNITQGSRANGNSNRGTSILNFSAVDKTLSTYNKLELGLLKIKNKNYADKGINIPSMAIHWITFSLRYY